MRCAACGHDNEPGGAFCAACGSPQGATRSAPAARHVARERGGGPWIVWWLALGPAIVVLGALLLLPMGSLLRDEAGATLSRDASVGLVAGLVVAALGVVALRALRDQMPDEEGLPAAVGVVGLVAGLLVSFLLVGAARSLSRADIVLGSVEGADDVYWSVFLLGALLWLGVGVALVPREARAGRFLVGGAFVLLLGGFALLALSLWTLLNAPELAAAAASRDRRGVPGPALLWLLAAVALAAWATRRRRA